MIIIVINQLLIEEAHQKWDYKTKKQKHNEAINTKNHKDALPTLMFNSREAEGSSTACYHSAHHYSRSVLVDQEQSLMTWRSVGG